MSRKGVVLVSDALRDYEMPQWITSFYKSRGLDIEPAAAALLAEYAGTDMSRIMLETEKMQKISLRERCGSMLPTLKERRYQQAVQHL